MPVLPDGTIIVDDAPNDSLYYGRHREEWSPVVEEAPNDDQFYVRQKHAWVAQTAAQAGLTITEIVPAIANVGMAGNLTARIFGTGFTATTVVLWDGLPLATAYVSADELSVTVNPSMAVAPQVALVEVIDGATLGTGAAGFHFVSPASVDFGIGLTEQPGAPGDPPIVHLQPAGDGPPTLGGVYVIDRQRNVEEGLELGADGRLRVPLATDRLAGSIVEPENDGKGYVRRRENGVSAWVPPSDTVGPDFGIGLTEQPGTDPGDPPIVHLQPAGDGPPTLGGVYVVDRVRNNTEGLELGADGRLRVPLATDSLAGAIVEPPPDDKGYVRRRDLNGVSAWVPPADTIGPDFGIGLTEQPGTDPGDPPIVHLQPAGDGPPTLGGVYVIDRQRNVEEGLELGADGRLRVPLATDNLAGAIVEPPNDGKGYVRRREAGVSAWVPPADTQTDFGIGLTEQPGTDPGDPPIVHLQPAGDGPPTLGGIYVVDRNRSLLSGLELSVDGQLKAPPATDALVGTLLEPRTDGLAYSRQWDATAQAWGWVPALTAGLQITSIIPNKALYGPTEPTPLVVHAYGSEFTATTVAVLDGADVATTIISDTELTFELNPRVPIAPGFHIVTVRDPAAVPPALAIGLGAEQFDWIKATTEVDYGTGLSLDLTPTPPMVNLQPAGDSPATLGGVYVIDRVRNNTEGLELGIDGRLRVPLATDSLAGAILEPPPDDKGYVRRRTPAGVSAWVPPSDTIGPDYGTGLTLDSTTPPGTVNLQPAGVAPALLGGVYVPTRDATQAADVDTNGGDGRLVVLTATDVLLGGMLEPPKDGTPYERQWNETAQKWEWVQPVATALDFGTGLTKDDTATPPIVHLQPAGDGPATLGGVYVIDRVRNNTEGLELGADGRLRVPPATDSLLGGILEPPADDKGYVRRRTAAGLSQWVPPAGGAAVIISDTPPPVTTTPPGTLWWESDSGDLFVLYDDGTSVQWVETGAGGDPGMKMHIGDDPPPVADVKVGDLWFDSNAGTLALYYQDVDSTQWVQIAGNVPPSSSGIAEAPMDGTPYQRQDAAWISATAAAATPGDVKSGFQTGDHAGWIKLDGRAVSTLTATQQAAAATLGFTTNLPNGDKCSLRMDSGALPGVVGGSQKITQANLPNYNLTAQNAGDHRHATGMVGGGTVIQVQNMGDSDDDGFYGTYTFGDNLRRESSNYGDGYMHKTTGAHGHTVPSGGSGTDYYVKAIVTNFFVYLGA